MKSVNTDSSILLIEAIIDLYLNVKIRKQEEIENYGKDEEEKERDKLRKTSPFTLIEYIKSSVEILIDLKVQEKLQEKIIKREENFNLNIPEEEVNEYEKLLRKHEADIRSYIKIEHQMKLYAESLQSKIEDFEKQIGELKIKNEELNNNQNFNRAKNSNKSNMEIFEQEIKNYKIEINQLNQLVKKYEEHNLKIPELEKKIKQQKLKHEKEIKDIENYYKEKIKKYEDKLKNNSPGFNMTHKHSMTTINTNHNNNTLNTLTSNINGNQNFFEYELNMKNKNEIVISKYPNEYATHRVVSKNDLLNNNFVKLNPKLNTNTKTIEDEMDRVNYEYSQKKVNKNGRSKSRSQSPDIKLTTNSKSNSNTTFEKRKDLDTITHKIDDFKKKAEKTLNQNLSNIINDLRTATKDRNNKSRSRDRINESDLEKRLKNCKTTINDNQQTLETTSRIDKSDISEMNITNSKTHRKYESHHNISSLLQKAKDYDSNPKSFYINNGSIIPELTYIKSNQINQIPSNIPKNSSSKKNHNRDNSRDFKEKQVDVTPNKNLVSKANLQNNSNIILNQQGVPCYNNINIYTSGLSALKAGNDCNLRNYILNKVHHKKSASSIKLNVGSQKKSQNHSRSNSIIGK